jgi:hypothetical protein
MMKHLVQSVAQHQVERGERYSAAMDAMSQAENGTQSHKIYTDLMRSDSGDTRKALGLPPAPKASGTKFDADTARKKYNY